MKVLICGSRSWREVRTICKYLDDVVSKYGTELTIVHGNCPTGADAIANGYCNIFNVPVIRYTPDWKTYGKAAGPIRNQMMLDIEKPDQVIAFDLGGRGTADMIRKAREAKVPVTIIQG